ncbi:MAG: hypothetical protein AAGA88_00280 [Pseudomonadota bacterium]
MRTILTAIGVLTTIALAGCASQTFQSVAGYDVPETEREVPTEFPNVYTSISRDDQLKSASALQSTKTSLAKDRDSHVTTTTTDIER